MLKEIHKSKCTFCEFTEPHYNQYDIIVEDLADIFTAEVQQQARENRSARIAQEEYREAVKEYRGPASNKPKLAEFKADPASYDSEEIVYRVYTYEHIPLDPERKKNPKKESEHYTRLNFIPFKHYIIKNGEAVEVGRSHSKDGEFSQEHGNMTDKLARMFMLLVERYSQLSNWRGYSYIDEMKGQSLLQLSSMGLQFNEAKSDNPFAYYTQSIYHAFTRVQNLEKKNQNIRDEILIDAGQTPSFSKQLEHEEAVRRLRESTLSGDDI
jgi:hypothetical protein